MPFDSWPSQASFIAIFDSLYLVAITARLIKSLKVRFRVNDDTDKSYTPCGVIIRLEEEGWALSFTVEMKR